MQKVEHFFTYKHDYYEKFSIVIMLSTFFCYLVKEYNIDFCKPLSI